MFARTLHFFDTLLYATFRENDSCKTLFWSVNSLLFDVLYKLLIRWRETWKRAFFIPVHSLFTLVNAIVTLYTTQFRDWIMLAAYSPPLKESARLSTNYHLMIGRAGTTWSLHELCLCYLILVFNLNFLLVRLFYCTPRWEESAEITDSLLLASWPFTFTWLADDDELLLYIIFVKKVNLQR